MESSVEGEMLCCLARGEGRGWDGLDLDLGAGVGRFLGGFEEGQWRVVKGN